MEQPIEAIRSGRESLTARYLAVFTSLTSAVRRPHRLHVTQRFTSSSSSPAPYCIRSFTKFTFADRWHESQNA